MLLRFGLEGGDGRGAAATVELEQTGNLKQHFMWSLPLCSHVLALKCTVQIRPQLLAPAGQVLARQPSEAHWGYEECLLRGPSGLPDHSQGSIQPASLPEVPNTPSGWGHNTFFSQNYIKTVRFRAALHCVKNKFMYYWNGTALESKADLR